MGEELLGNMRFEQKDKTGCFFILDIDSFKEINDKYGHPAGDRILRETAGKLKEVFENKGIIGRLGGDEFVALIHHPMSRAEIEKLLNQLREELKELKAGAVTCSIGVIPVEKQYTVEELYRSADRVLYEAKKRGKDQFVFGYHFPAKTSGRLSVFQGGGAKESIQKEAGCSEKERILQKKAGERPGTSK